MFKGSIEALAQALNKLNTDEVKVKIIHSGVGGINDTDVMLASASNAIIIGFNVRPDVNARKSAEQEHVDIVFTGSFMTRQMMLKRLCQDFWSLMSKK